jgi:hypothetical protein
MNFCTKLSEFRRGFLRCNFILKITTFSTVNQRKFNRTKIARLSVRKFSLSDMWEGYGSFLRIIEHLTEAIY